MVRTYRRKTARANTSPDTMLAAVRQVLLFKKTIRGAADEFGINYRTLARYCSKIPRAEVEGAAERPSCSVGFIGARQVFSRPLEAELVSYALLACNVNPALPPKSLRRLAFQLADAHRLPMPPSWSENKQASSDWLASFLKRHPLVSTSMLSSCPLEAFYSKLTTLMEKHQFRREDVWVVGETGVSTAQRPDRVVSRSAKRSCCADRGPLVSVACAVSAAAALVPPFFVFPRVQFREHFLAGAPAGSGGGADLSGWMREEQFVQFVEHFARHTDGQRRRLLLVESGTALVSIAGLDALRARGVLALSVPPQLAPLEGPVFGPLRSSISRAIDGWTRAGPGRSLTIHHVPALVGAALPLQAPPDAVALGFKACGIVPLDPSASTRLHPEPNAPQLGDFPS